MYFPNCPQIVGVVLQKGGEPTGHKVIAKVPPMSSKQEKGHNKGNGVRERKRKSLEERKRDCRFKIRIKKSPKGSFQVLNLISRVNIQRNLQADGRIQPLGPGDAASFCALI